MLSRMQSLQARNMVETRKPVAKRRRYQLKTYITKAGKLGDHDKGVRIA